MKPELCGEVKIPIRVLTNTSGEEKMQRLFVIGDSFAEKYVIYFSAHAAATYNFRTVFEFNPSVYQKYKPDLVVQEMLNMYLLNNPPRNPPEIKAARIRALEKKNVAPVSTPEQ